MKSMSYRGFKVVASIILACATCVGCSKHKTVESGPNANGDSLSIFLDHGFYPFGTGFQPLEQLAFLPHSVLYDFWKSKHFLTFRDSSNYLVFDEDVVGGKVESYLLVYANITDSRIRLEKGLHTGLSRADVLHRLELDSIADDIQKVCLNFDASTTFYFSDGLLTRVVIRTDRELLRNPDPVFAQRYAGQVVGYTGKNSMSFPRIRVIPFQMFALSMSRATL